MVGVGGSKPPVPTTYICIGSSLAIWDGHKEAVIAVAALFLAEDKGLRSLSAEALAEPVLQGYGQCAKLLRQNDYLRLLQALWSAKQALIKYTTGTKRHLRMSNSAVTSRLALQLCTRKIFLMAAS